MTADLPGFDLGPAGAALHAQLIDLAERRIFPPCAEDPDAWFDPRRLKAAAAACLPCPALEWCGAAGEEQRERFGTWGGVVREAS